VRAGAQSYEGRTLVAADGANGRTATLAGVGVQRELGIAYEGNVSVTGPYPAAWENIFGVDVGTCPGGYGWLFPKGDHANIGIGGRWAMGPSLRKRLDSLTRYYGFDASRLWGVRGHPLPVRRPGSPVSSGNVLVVGDAAGLIDVLSGEGIHAAVSSGGMAVRHIEAYLSGTAPDLSAYQAEMDSTLLRDLAVSLQLYEIFHLSPSLAVRLVRRSTRTWRLMCGLITGHRTYASIKQRSRLLAGSIDVAAAIGRRAGAGHLDSGTPTGASAPAGRSA
jgi:flavin-dependent dehydrogenase